MPARWSSTTLSCVPRPERPASTPSAQAQADCARPADPVGAANEVSISDVRLARPVRPEQREHAAARDPKVPPGKHAHVAVGPDQSARLYRQLTAHLPGPGGPRHVHDAPRLSSSAYSLRIIA